MALDIGQIRGIRIRSTDKITAYCPLDHAQTTLIRIIPLTLTHTAPI
ncbi:hypothetical protein EIO_1535 [Ketogulonicigenium vulgare Y25]|uniref:Uncharacterized protein n=1 Tax=Ketogulonicigenium vulgare (strain WSH-001) TaxID=759362 RepID=F9Y629_KETVW|nr:hypothetical protein EIO_1535 [Ketogulonicigenium vulgare Y25]AEM40854.1 hypothetical protein KVU_1015 [Ketogulonicigenium vulgare WSH-001]ALJ81016.1 hypothetical protein KVH_07375 [Ketogulonicigenium vulgare]ANW35022.1 hypothetical protein KvSKV_07345 [Ketogulonicigenium vulgare]